VNLNILPLGSYDLLINMDWLDSHKTNLDCYSKTLDCENEEGRRVTLQGIQNIVSVCVSETNINPTSEEVL
jgi:hypothetical protein